MRAGLFIVALLAGLICSGVHARSSVWKVSDSDSHVYVAASIHYLGENDYPLPCEFEFVYGLAEQMTLEVDHRVLKHRAFQRRQAAGFYFADGSSLYDRLTPANRIQLDELLAEAGLGSEPYARMKPAVLASVLTNRRLTQNVRNPRGLEAYLIDLAATDRKPIEFIDTPDQYIARALKLTDGHEDEYLIEVIDHLAQLDQTMLAIKPAWRQGDIEAMSSILEIPRLLDRGPPFLRTDLIQKNLAWLRAIEALLATPATALLVIDAANLVTDSGVLSLLGIRGYQIARVNECRS